MAPPISISKEDEAQRPSLQANLVSKRTLLRQLTKIPFREVDDARQCASAAVCGLKPFNVSYRQLPVKSLMQSAIALDVQRFKGYVGL
jgi:hypothetical protein